MFFLPPKYPVNDKEKKWIEESMLWLVEQFGSQTLCEAEVILPLSEYFPDPFHGTKGCVQKIVNRICTYMNVDPSRIELEIYSEGRLPPFFRVTHRGTAGLYLSSKNEEKVIIAVESSKLSDPPSVVATIAHEVGHILLLGDKKPSGDERYQEHLTDLVPVFFGLGILTANVAFQFSQRQYFDTKVGTFVHSWTASCQGYLSEPMYGYALASFAWMRGERKPDWAKYLTLNIRTYLRRSLKYLQKTGDTILPIYQRNSSTPSDAV